MNPKLFLFGNKLGLGGGGGGGGDVRAFTDS